MRPPVLKVVCALACSGCFAFPGDDAIVYQSLDYHLDRPRLLGLALDPTVLTAGQETSFEVFILGPEGQSLSSVAWQSCGLTLDGAVSFYDLSCFSDDLEVSALGTGNPLRWTPPEPPGCADTGWGCTSYVPFLMTAAYGETTVSGAFFASLHSSAEVVDAAPSWRGLPLTITAGPVTDGQVALEAWLGTDADQLSVRWYVDDGVLLDTARTALQGARDGGVYSTNRWVLPEGSGSWRVVVVVSSYDGYSDGAGFADPTGAEDWFAWSEVPNMTWAEGRVEVP